MSNKTPHGNVLDSKEELFAQDVARGSTLSDAYRNHYSVDNMQAKSIHVEASRLKKIPKVSLRIAELKKQAADLTIVDVSMVIEGLLKEAKEEGDGSSHSARITAWAHLGKHLGMFTEKVELTGKDGASLQPPVFNIIGVKPNGDGSTS